MTESKFEAASQIAKRATAITASIEKLQASPPGNIEIRMELIEKQDPKTVRIDCQDSGLPTDLVVRIHALILEDLIKERDELKAEFKEL